MWPATERSGVCEGKIGRLGRTMVEVGYSGTQWGIGGHRWDIGHGMAMVWLGDIGHDTTMWW